ncbi:hypothetical protein CISIN_1g0378902mg, partial [Citrus sinensis]
MAKSGSGFGLS